MSRPVPHARRMSPGGEVFVGAVIACGAVTLAFCARELFIHGVPPLWWVFAVLTVASGSLRVKVPSLDATLSVSEMFAFTGLLLFGPSPGAAILASDGLLHSLRRRSTWQQSLFNCANLAVSSWISAHVFFAVSGTAPLLRDASGAGSLILPLGLMTLTYFALNSALTATAVALEARLRPFAVWYEHFLWMCPPYLAAASIALLLVVALRQVHLSALALIPPLLVVSYLTLRSTLGRVEDAHSHLNALNRLYLSTIETLASAIDAKDDVTHSHIRRVQIGAVGLARELGVTDQQTLKAIEAAALLHDTGKLAVPEHILNKPGKLTTAEYERMKLHAPIGAEILGSIDFPYPVVPIVRHHHENWDGTGYPDRLSGADIPIGARILAVVDCYDALTSDRPYRRRLPSAEALAIIRERRGTMYDPIVVDAFLTVHEHVMPSAADELHPAAKAIGEARARDEAAEAVRSATTSEPAVTEEALAVASLARALAGDASVSDLGALVWMLLRQLVPCEACCLFLPDGRDAVVAQYSAGLPGHAPRPRMAIGTGIAGWVAAARRPALNADPALDLGAAASDAGLSASLTIPLTHNGTLVAVLSAYASAPFGDDHERLLALLAPRMALAVASLPRRHEHPSLMPHADLAHGRTVPDLRIVRGGLV